MIQTSTEFGGQMGSNARKILVRFLLDGVTVEGNIKEVTVHKGACGDGEFTIGSVYSSYIDATIDDCPIRLENEELELQIGLRLTDETIEYCTVGFYTASDVSASVGSTTFTGLGRLSTKFSGGYFSDTGFPQSVQSTLAEIAQQTGISIDASAWDISVLRQDIETSMDGLLHREAVMYIAGLLGGFATESNTGGVVIRPFGASAVAEVDAERTTEMYAFGDYNYTVNGIKVLVSSGGETEDGETVDEVSYVYGTPNITLSNPYMTKALFDLMAPQITGYTYRPGTIPVSMGDIRLEAGDVVTVKDTAGESYTVPCLNLVHTYDGGLMTTITAPGASTTEQEAAFTGSLTAAVEQTATELLVAKKVVATKIEAVEADVGKLVAENAEIKTAVIGKADISDVNAANAAIEQLQAVDATLQDALINKANVTDLTAVNANLQNVTADVANINSLLAGSAGVGTLQAIHLTSDNVVIDDATITSAMIADLAASKITSGTLDTNKVAIQSDSGNLIIKDNTIQAADKSSVVRVQIGEDGNGDYNLYLWDTDGNLLWDAGGVTSSGLHDGIIKDVNVAADAAIAGSKLDIASVAERLNEDGSITVDSSQVTVDDATLAAAYKTLTQQVTDVTTTFGTLTTEMEVVQGQIENKVWQTDITDVVNPISGNVKTLQDQYTAVTQTVNDIQVDVGAVKTTVAENYEELDKKITSISATAEGITTTVSSLQSKVDNLESVKDMVSYYALGTSSTEPPSSPGVDVNTEEMEVDGEIYYVVSSSGGSEPFLLLAATWVPEQPTAADGEYVWLSYRVEYLDGAIKWTEPVLLTDGYTRSEVKTVESKIEQLADSITLSVSGGLGDTATIKLAVGDDAQTETLDMSAVRQKFAEDTSEVTVKAGTVTFEAGKLLINGGNFTLDENGTMSATNGNFSGTITANSGTIGGLSISTTSDSTDHVYKNTIYTQTIGIEETVRSGDGTATVTVDTQFGMKPASSSLSDLALYLLAKLNSTQKWTNDTALFSVNHRGKVKCSGIDLYSDRSMGYQNNELLAPENSGNGAPLLISTDDNRLYLNNVIFREKGMTGECNGIISDIDPRFGATDYNDADGQDLGGAEYPWRRIYVRRIYRDGESSISDRKDKKDISPIPEDSKDLIMSLKPVQYRWNRGTDERLHWGFIAQEVANAAQGTVGDVSVFQAVRKGTENEEHNTDYESIPDSELQWYLSYQELIAPMVSTIQEQERRIGHLERMLKKYGLYE